VRVGSSRPSCVGAPPRLSPVQPIVYASVHMARASPDAPVVQRARVHLENRFSPLEKRVMSHRLSVVGLLVLGLALVPAGAAAQQALPIGGSPQSGQAAGAVATYTFEASSAGVLTVAVKGEGDLMLEVADSDGQVLPDGSSDRDLFGALGNELLSVILGEPGTYRVNVRLLDGAESFQVAGAWMAFPAFARPSDADGRPSRAVALEIGRDREDALDSQSGDLQDWFVITPATDGVLTVVLRPLGDEIDLVLELFVEDFGSPKTQSDQDLQDNPANEAATLSVTGGQPVHIKVGSYGTGVSGRYRLSTSLLD
jgi:hypothetical protein